MVTFVKAIFTGSKVYREGVCLSTDTKPTNDESMMNGSQLIEMDTSKIYFWDADNNTWREFA